MFRQWKVTQPLQDGIDSQQSEEHYLVITPVIGQHEILSSYGLAPFSREVKVWTWGLHWWESVPPRTVETWPYSVEAGELCSNVFTVISYYGMHELISRTFELISRKLISWELISRELILRDDLCKLPVGVDY